MGTRSIIGFPYGDGVKGRYCHWDGYPSGVGCALWKIIERDGVDKALDVLTQQYYGWSSLNAEDFPELSSSRSDGRFVSVPGYGIAYTTEQGQSAPDQWCESPGDSGWTEWAYAIASHALVVFRVVDESGPPQLVGIFHYSSPEPDWESLENYDEQP